MAKQPRDPDNIYEKIKATVSFEKVFDFLGLDMKPCTSRTVGRQYRGPDPVCGRGGDRALVYTISKKSWCCQSDVCSPKDANGKAIKTKGGDQIGLVAHVKGIKQSEAAVLLRDAFLREPEKPKASKSSQRKTAKPRGASKSSKPAARRVQVPVRAGVQVEPVGGTGDGYSIADHLEHWT